MKVKRKKLKGSNKNLSTLIFNLEKIKNFFISRTSRSLNTSLKKLNQVGIEYFLSKALGGNFQIKNLNRKHGKIILFFDAFFMFEIIKNIYELSKKRINFLHNVNNKGWYNGHKTYIEGIKEELKETSDEIKENNSVYLEDELGDVFWDYLCLLHSLEQEKKIVVENVFSRCYKKFSERLGESADFEAVNWEGIKQKQKEELKIEHNFRYNNK